MVSKLWCVNSGEYCFNTDQADRKYKLLVLHKMEPQIHPDDYNLNCFRDAINLVKLVSKSFLIPLCTQIVGLLSTFSLVFKIRLIFFLHNEKRLFVVHWATYMLYIISFIYIYFYFLLFFSENNQL